MPFDHNASADPNASTDHNASAATPKSAIRAEGLTLAYGPHQGIFDISFELGSGICALVGKNGAGKSTLLESLQGLRVPQSGSASICGHDPVRERSVVSSILGGALQSATPYPSAKAAELLTYVASLYPNPATPMDLIETFDIPLGTAIKSFSGGEVQRLKCAMALIGQPKVVILDEPTAGLDPGARLNLYGVLNQYSEMGVAMLISTHLTEDLDAMADRALIIDSGRIVSDVSETDVEATEILKFQARTGLPIEQLQNALSGEYRVSSPTNGIYSVQSDKPIPASVLATVASWCAEHNSMTHELTISKNSLASTVMSHFSDSKKVADS